MCVLIQVMDDRWEKEVTEFGAINVTGFRVVDFSRKVVRDFGEIWKKNGISVSHYRPIRIFTHIHGSKPRRICMYILIRIH